MEAFHLHFPVFYQCQIDAALLARSRVKNHSPLAPPPRQGRASWSTVYAGATRILKFFENLLTIRPLPINYSESFLLDVRYPGRKVICMREAVTT